MKNRKVLALLLGCAMFISSAGYSAQKESKIHKDVQEKSAQEWVSVIIELADPEIDDRDTAKDLTKRQKQVVKDRYKDLLAELKGTKHKVLDGYDNDPFVAMDVEPYVLTILERSVNVKWVNLNYRLHLHLSQSMPMVNDGNTSPWPAGATGKGQTIAIIDSGVQRDPPFSGSAR